MTAPIQCEPWCVHGDGHPGADYPEDQTCDGIDHRSPASLLPPQRQRDGSPLPESISVYAERPGGTSEAHIAMGLSERPLWVTLSIDDAAALIVSLQAAMDEMADQ